MNKKNIMLLFIAFTAVRLYPCSIVAYLGDNLCKSGVIESLSRLQYRGYDSAGFACLDQKDNSLVCVKASGHLDKLKEKLNKNTCDGYIGIGHTRWATHGAATEINAHPHLSSGKSVALVHNGIIENYDQLKKQLSNLGYTFISDTDTEVIANLFEFHLQEQDSLNEAVVEVVQRLDGSYGFITLLQDQPDMLVAVRKSSPICIGLGDNEIFVASDVLAFAGKTKNVAYLPDESFAIIKKNNVYLFDFNGNELALNIEAIDLSPATYQKLGHEHFMLKEIYEQRKVIHDSVDYYASLETTVATHLGLSTDIWQSIKRIEIIGCGTSWHAGRIAKFFFEIISKVPVGVHLASEFRYMPFFHDDDTLYITISQSGETADTLEAARLILNNDVPVIAITNVASSSLAREATGFLLTQAGPEIAVASTKAFTTQITALYWLAHYMAIERGHIDATQLKQAEQNLKEASIVLENMIEKYKMDIMQRYAQQYARYKRYLFLGRHIGYPFAMEAALKLKEISYIFAQGYPAGELKHGAIALIDDETPVVVFSHLDPLLYKKLVAGVQEIKARKAHVLAFAFEGQDELIKLADHSFVIPRVAPLLEPLAMAGLMQFFVYEIAKKLGRDIDKPRNLAKAVTVE